MEPTHTPAVFSFGVRLGIFLTVEAAGLSAIAVTGLLSYVAFRTYKRVQFRRRLRKRPNARTDLAFDAADSSFFLNLMVADLIQALGGLFNIRWVAEAHITEGSYCTAQGVFKQMGDVGVALTSLAIACQTFVVLVLRVNAPTYVNKIVIALIWIFITLVIGVSAGVNNRDGQYYGNTDYWCWITRQYKVERIVFEYLWMWIAGGIMLILYGVIFLVMRGLLNFSGGTTHPGPAKVAPQHDGKKDRKSAVANLMLFYPAVYICCILPVCVVRWMDFNGKSVPPAATIFASIVFSLSGLFNVTLYCLTRPQLVSGPRLPTPQRHSRSFSTQKPFQVRHKLGHLPDIDDDFADEEVERRGYPSQTYPPSHSYGSGRLPDVEYDAGQGRLPSIEYPHDRGRLVTPDGNSLWSSKSGARPGTGDIVTSEGPYGSKAHLGRLPDF